MAPYQVCVLRLGGGPFRVILRDVESGERTIHDGVRFGPGVVRAHEEPNADGAEVYLEVDEAEAI